MGKKRAGAGRGAGEVVRIVERLGLQPGRIPHAPWCAQQITEVDVLVVARLVSQLAEPVEAIRDALQRGSDSIETIG